MSFPTKIGSSGSIRRFSATHRLVENARSLANSETCTLPIMQKWQRVSFNTIGISYMWKGKLVNKDDSENVGLRAMEMNLTLRILLARGLAITCVCVGGVLRLISAPFPSE